AEIRHLLHFGSFFVKDEPGDYQGLPILKSDQRLRPPGDEGGNREAEQIHAVCVIRLRDLGLDQQFDIVAADNGRDELNRSTKGLEDDRRVERLCDYDWNLAAGEEF